MQVLVKVKSITKQKPVIDLAGITVRDGIANANELVEDIVRRNVKEYNQQETEKSLFFYLTNEEIQNMAKVGKIGFKDKKSDRQQDEEKAVENALQCFEDGIFRLLINEKEIGYNQEITLNEGDTLVFIRLTMLAGRLW